VAARRSFGRIDHANAGQIADPVRREIGFGKDGDHAGDFTRSFQIQPNDVSKCEGRAQHIGLQHAGHVVIGHISPASGQEALILEPGQGMTLIPLPQPLAFPLGRRSPRTQRQVARAGRERLPYSLGLAGLEGKTSRTGSGSARVKPGRPPVESSNPGRFRPAWEPAAEWFDLRMRSRFRTPGIVASCGG
jgi:hypothetical protein